MKTRTIAYWTTTGLVVFVMLSGAAGELLQQWGTPESMTILGFPAYVLTIIGLWKVLGSIAILAPRFPRLKNGPTPASSSI